MPPKPKTVYRRKNSATTKETPKATANSKPEADGANSAKSNMPPPPPPAGILEPEINALATSLRNAVVKTAQIYGFYYDAHKLGIQRYASSPQSSLTAALGREVESYDQMCDAIESRLLRAISVLKRDLDSEERRIQEAKAAVASNRTNSPDPMVMGEQIPTMGTLQTSNEGASSTQLPPHRRPSAISLSSLHRPRFPLKLDLSSSTLRLTTEEANMFSSSLASPLTLAPKSARATSDIPDFIAAFTSASAMDPTNRAIDIDLTMPDNEIPTTRGDRNGLSLEATVGSTVDKPIELDLEAMDMDIEMADLFGDSAESTFSPPTGAHSLLGGKTIKQEPLPIEMLDVFTSDSNNDLFATLGEKGSENDHSLGAASSRDTSMLGGFPTSDLPVQGPLTKNGNAPELSFDLGALDLPGLSPSAFFSEPQGGDINFDVDMSWVASESQDDLLK